MKIHLKLESEIPPTLIKYGKVRLPSSVIPLLSGGRKTINIKYAGGRHSLKIDRYGRTTLPSAIAEESRGKSKMIIEMKDGEVTLEFQ
ncbi:MAG: hypothetical protein N3H84_02440 [Candidatus Caldarchaeum sp.]|nr:hypothetical protein [Candidatus Caldarchaeum sp.]MCX8200947.1 hypothetical protein [Candidatus Caldarchaeum sp.]MDW8434686.1 hypothetical protein [Candidatus Caldarchaeum sp.]